MNSSILTAIESLCDDIATNTNPEENKKRAEAVVSLAFAGIFTPAEYDDEYEDETSECEAAGDKTPPLPPGLLAEAWQRLPPLLPMVQILRAMPLGGDRQ